ncbi:hypothetical protein [Bacillus sp. T33-2]|uniref:hypothetical protein n=1 Tax=Bacillus sp. T33-2 TaxID=2054168 RepID=UPI000C7716CF|nr:hypothetical protein [Bacillus sp. T33-2]PLR98181.1 hypothetical protein CVD19_06195 [Bacillus sp. T33-2]
MIKQFRKSLLLIIAVLVLAACSDSGEEKQKSASDAVQAAFKSKPKDANNSYKDIDYYLPFGVEVEKESPNNIILKNGKKTYILFYNQHEQKDSEVVYQSTVKQRPEWDFEDTYKNDGKFGYMLMKKADNDAYELVVGIGGVKLTTETKSLQSDAAAMMEIAKSVKFKK